MSSVLFDVYVVMYHEASKVKAHNVVAHMNIKICLMP